MENIKPNLKLLALAVAAEYTATDTSELYHEGLDYSDDHDKPLAWARATSALTGEVLCVSITYPDGTLHLHTHQYDSRGNLTTHQFQVACQKYEC